MNFVDFQTDMVRLAKQIARTGNDMVVKAASNPAEVGGLAHSITRDYVQLAHEARGAIATSQSMEVTTSQIFIVIIAGLSTRSATTNFKFGQKSLWFAAGLSLLLFHSLVCSLKVGNRLRSAVQELGVACIALVQDAGNLQANPTDAFAKRDLNEHNKAVSEKVSEANFFLNFVENRQEADLCCFADAGMHVVCFFAGVQSTCSAASWIAWHPGLYQRCQYCERYYRRPGHDHHVRHGRNAQRRGRRGVC